MRNLLTKKLNSDADKGFTLAELLIVVAIIAVLAVIAIPIFSTKLEKSREETDIANLRSAKAAAVAQYFEGTDLDGNTLTSTDAVCYFDAVAGTLVKAAPTAYGKGTSTDGGCGTYKPVSTEYTGSTVAAGQTIKVTINDDGVKDIAFTTKA